MRKWLAFTLSLVALLLFPAVFLYQVLAYPVGGSYFWLILLSPSGLYLLPGILLGCAPLLVPVFSTLYPGKKLPKLPTILVIIFTVLWLMLSVPFLLVQMQIINYQDYNAILYYENYARLAAYLPVIAYVIHAIITAIKNKRAGQKLSRSAIIILTIFIVLSLGIGGTITAIDAHYRARYNAVKNEVEKIEAKSITPHGGKEWDYNKYSGSAQDRGNGIGGLKYCATNSCPNVAKSWFVSIEPGKEYEFIKDLANQNGFKGAVDQNKSTCEFSVPGVSSSDCTAAGENGTLYIVLRLEPKDETLRDYPEMGLKLPKLDDASPRVWRQLNIDLTRTWGN